MIRTLLLALALVLTVAPAEAHKPSDSYLSLSVDGALITGRWDVALRDLDDAIGLDRDEDGAIRWGELRTRFDELGAYLLSRLRITADHGDCPAQPLSLLTDQHTDGAYAVLGFTATCPDTPRRLDIRYRLFFDRDPQHRGLLQVRHGVRTESAVLGPGGDSFSLTEAAAPDVWHALASYAREGVWHIWIGYDHILFLVSLLLPAVLRRSAGRWQEVEYFRPALMDTVKIVTAFTLAHSLTLGAAVLGPLELPSRWVESAIALSVVLASLNNLTEFFRGPRWGVAFGFGLVHGFGFASVLGDLGLPGNALLPALAGFNLGVEAGQLAIVTAFLPLAFRFRGSLFYRRIALGYGSAAIIAIASVWLIERSLGLDLYAAWHQISGPG